MLIHAVLPYDSFLPEYIRLWEENMREPWADYDGADRFIVRHGDDIVGGFAIYWDESDGVAGNFMSGWAERRRGVPVDKIIQRAADNVGELYFKTPHRHVKIILNKLGEHVKNEGAFAYYKVKGEYYGATKEC